MPGLPSLLAPLSMASQARLGDLGCVWPWVLLGKLSDPAAFPCLALTSQASRCQPSDLRNGARKGQWRHILVRGINTPLDVTYTPPAPRHLPSTIPCHFSICFFISTESEEAFPRRMRRGRVRRFLFSSWERLPSRKPSELPRAWHLLAAS